MALLKQETKENNQAILSVGVDKETFAAAVDKAYRKTAPRINVPGFRKGKAPRAVIEKMYGKDMFYQDALEDLYPTATEEAIEASGLRLVGGQRGMKFDLVRLDEEGAEYTLTVVTYPDVSIADYKGIAVEKDAVEVSDADIDAEIDRLRERNARTIAVEDRAAALGDIAVFDFLGTVDGVAFEGGAAEKFELELGSGRFIPGFEEQLAGHSVGEKFDVNVTFPEEYGAAELAGKAAVFAITLHELKAKELPVADDEFAQDVSEFDTLQALRDDWKAKELVRREEKAGRALENRIADKLAELVVGEFPDVMADERIDNNIHEMEHDMSRQGLTLAQYLQFTGMTMETLREQMKENADKQIKYRAALEAVAVQEKLMPSDETIDAEIAKMAEEYKVPADRVADVFPREEIARDLGVKAAMDWVKENAKVTEIHEADNAGEKAE